MDEVFGEDSAFYSKAEVYWKQVPPTVDGMLGGYGSISNVDINGSKKFMQKFLGVSQEIGLFNSILNGHQVLALILLRHVLPKNV